ncbi:hypothetical protein G4V62_03055 [Bacillaceae bacterium SIJ1]|uniref:cell wall hydrolase n=1 Tax=Litoribacterium kuwaitense TaxID=1398745 RepID=UPI0013EA9E7D|nr:cell wall hydrolase [Litoribacterium kuwaitense]NGP43977.1 hypothetical protein [Litoribacterium kuwaitense]
MYDQKSDQVASLSDVKGGIHIKRITSILLCTICLVILHPFHTKAEKMFTETTIVDVQKRLKSLGYAVGSKSGQWSSQTENALKQFQDSRGLHSNGELTNDTLQKLYSQTITKKEIRSMAKAVHGEARGESMRGQVAVAAVILNRLESQEFPNTVSGVIYQENAFTAIQDGQYALEPNDQAYEAVYYALQGWDPTGQALYYYNPNTATSQWIFTRATITQIGGHVFAQ